MSSMYTEAAVEMELISPHGAKISLFAELDADKSNFDPRTTIDAFTTAIGPGRYRLTIRAERLPWHLPDPPGELPSA